MKSKLFPSSTLSAFTPRILRHIWCYSAISGCYVPYKCPRFALDDEGKVHRTANSSSWAQKCSMM
eukprot:scaffold4286_cov92-Amphora_coffeaeformis.AAC.3